MKQHTYPRKRKKKSYDTRIGTHLTPERRSNVRLGMLKYYTNLTDKERKLRYKLTRYRFTKKQRLSISLAHIGLKLTAETKHKMSISTKKYWNSPLGIALRKRLSIMFTGRILSVKTRRKMSQSRTGNLSNNWQGGSSFLPYSSGFNMAFKESIRERDNHICQLCGIPEIECSERLSTHHIDYNKEHTVPENCIALCRSCNSVINGDHQFWRDYFTSTTNNRRQNNGKKNN